MMNKSFYQTIFAVLICAAGGAAAATTARAQAAQGNNFIIEQAVVAAGGGGTSSAVSAGGTQFVVTGTTGQALASRPAARAPFNVQSGFWTSEIVPTAASVAVGGRVLAETGGGLRNARVTLVDQHGNQRTTLTGAFGYYRFTEVAPNQTIVVSVVSKRYQFAAQAVTVNQEIEDLNFSVAPPGGKQ